MIAQHNNNNNKIKLPSISELTKTTDIKLPSISNSPSNSPASPNYSYYNYNNYTHQQLGHYQQPPVVHQQHAPVPQVGPIAPMPAHQTSPSPQQMQQPPQHMQQIPQAPQQIPQPQRMYQLPPYYPIYYNQQSQLPSPPTNYMVPEIINKPINKCHRCGTTETPEWRRGPNGVRTLCNACGLYHAKLVKRKGAAIAAQEVLNNKVCKGKNGRRITIKKNLINNKMNIKINMNKQLV